MAKQIKVIECPKCGSTTPVSIGTDRYRCDKCNTEFFLDTDDININVRHQQQTPQPQYTFNANTNKKVQKAVGIFAVVFVVFIIMINVLSGVHKKSSSRGLTTSRENVTYNTLVPINGKAVLVCITNTYNYSNSDNREYYAIFRDVVSGKVLKKTRISNLNSYVNTVKSRFFLSDSTYYLVVQNQWVYKIDLRNETLTDYTSVMASSKPALNAGFSSINFIDNDKGEGFNVVTKLGKQFYYFPKTDGLYTEKAFEYVADGGMATLLPGATDGVYYDFLQKENKVSSKVSQIVEFKYKFNDGGPEQKITYLGNYQLSHLSEHRVTSYKAITEDFIAFDPEILYTDNAYILISYRATAAQDAPTNVQLFTVKGEAVWSVSFDFNLDCKSVVRTSKGFMLQADEDKYYEISIDGQNKKLYEFPEYD